MVPADADSKNMFLGQALWLCRRGCTCDTSENFFQLLILNKPYNSEVKGDNMVAFILETIPNFSNL